MSKYDRETPAQVLERFMGHVEPEPNTGCWLWTAYCAPGGYGAFSIKRRRHVAHRFSYEAFVGPIPDGLQIDHLCRVPWCVNPDHLEPVTGSENVLRAVAANPKRQHCKRGHRFDAENTVWINRGQDRACRECRRMSNRKTQERRVAKRRVWAAQRRLTPGMKEYLTGAQRAALLLMERGGVCTLPALFSDAVIVRGLQRRSITSETLHAILPWLRESEGTAWRTWTFNAELASSTLSLGAGQ